MDDEQKIIKTDLEETTDKTEKKQKKETWGDALRFAIIVFLIIIPIRMFIIEPYMVRGESMWPNFENNDYLLVEKISAFGEIKYDRGEIVIFKTPVDKKVLIKRIIGLPNETIKIENGAVYIQNKPNEGFLPLTENYLKNKSDDNLASLTLKGDEYFVMGDNRPVSYDSRYWGPLPKENLIGRPIIRLYHFDKIGIWPAKN